MIIDLTLLSLGIETVGGFMTKIIPRNSILPCKRSAIFTTYSDHQTSVEIKVFEGERNHLLKSFSLENISPTLRGIPIIEISMEIDVNGIVIVSAKDLSNNNLQKIIITNDVGCLSCEKIYENIEQAKKDSNSLLIYTDITEKGLVLYDSGKRETQETINRPLLMITHSE